MEALSGARAPARDGALCEAEMSRAHWLGNLTAIVVPFAACVPAVVLLWGNAAGPRDLAIAFALYLSTMLGVTVGFHRLLTHRAFQTTRATKCVLAVLGSMAVQGPVAHWVADHRRHHAFADAPGDPHSPHGAAENGGGTAAGLWHAHVGWLLTDCGVSDQRRYAPDLLEDRDIVLVDKLFGVWVALGLAIPFALGALLAGTLQAGLTALLWGGLVRVFLAHHVTWSINSICHFAGRRRFATADHSTNVALLALPSLGESWHHNHHAFPRSAFHGLSARELDPSGWAIRALRRLGLAWDVIEITPERIAARAATRAS